jgi:voltage-dependent potassium channel beta subunit
MEYRRLGRSGIKVSVFSLGSWITFSNQADVDAAAEMMTAAYEAGVNFFDNAEVYAGGKSEEVMGAALKKLGWRRGSYLVSTKFFWGLHQNINEQNTLNRKRLMDAMDAALKRYGLDYIDLVFCHRADPETPIEETAHAMHDIVASGRAMYWGVSEWSADEIRAAWAVCDKYGWHKPVMEQPQYNLFIRKRVEDEYARLYEDIGLGTTTWSPLASGLLTGKYNNGIPADSRGALPGYEWLRDALTDSTRLEKVRKLQEVADGLGCSLAQLSLAWCAKNPNVSTVITGASKVAQVHENLKALDVLPKLTPEVMAQINEVVGKDG